jgi:hypothetical protein
VSGVSGRLTKAMGRLAEDCAAAEPPLEIEVNLLAEFDRTNRRKRFVSWTVQAGAIAAALLLVGLALRDPQYSAPPQAAFDPVLESEQPFIPIPYVAPLAPYERAEIVRMNLPVAALIAAGFTMRTNDPGTQVEADVIVGQDGRARAVRLVSISNLN